MAARPKKTPRQSNLFASYRWLEEELALQNVHHLVGIDEAGRGPLAGPVVAAAVCLPPGTRIPQLDDSKRLTEKQRELLFNPIREVSTAIGVGIVSASEIDEINILQATLKAMRLALSQLLCQLDTPPQLILVDGNQKFPCDLPLRTVIQGDHLCHNIAAASIIAKVTRDQLMLSYHQLYPLYDFASHKGYGSTFHRQAIKDHGPTPLHRFSFKGVLLPHQEIHSNKDAVTPTTPSTDEIKSQHDDTSETKNLDNERSEFTAPKATPLAAQESATTAPPDQAVNPPKKQKKPKKK